jgi:hypothetical protein
VDGLRVLLALHSKDEWCIVNYERFRYFGQVVEVDEEEVPKYSTP